MTPQDSSGESGECVSRCLDCDWKKVIEDLDDFDASTKHVDENPLHTVQTGVVREDE